MSSYYTLQVLHSDVTVPERSKAPNLYVKISYGDQTLRTSSVNDLPPQWNETFPITSSDSTTPCTIKLKREETFSKEIGHVTCTVKELLRENGEDVHITLQSQDQSRPLVALCLRPSDRMKNAAITLMNLAHTLLGLHPFNDSSLAEKVNTIFDAAKRVAESKACQSLVEAGYSITAFVEFGDMIADASPYLKLVWCITTIFIKIITEQPRTDKRVMNLVKNLVNLFLVIKETSAFPNPSKSLLSVITELLEFITQCSTLLQDYTRKSFIVRAVLQNKKAAIVDLETTVANLKTDLISAFERQGIIEAQIRALREELEKKLQPKNESGRERRRCLEGTRIELLEEIEKWVQDTSAPNVFFILGHAGAGKSTIATTVAETYQKKRQLGSHQYFLRGKSDPYFIFRTIAYGLAKQNKSVAEAIRKQLEDNDLDSVTPERAFEILLFEPLHTLVKEDEQGNTLIVLDALDECGSRETRGPYIRLIKEKLQTLPTNYRFLITSRPEEDIATPEALESACLRNRWIDQESQGAKNDVLRYIEVELGKLRDDGRIRVEPEWPWDDSMRVLGDSAGGLFIWAATAVRLIESKKGNKAAELKRLVRIKSLSLDDLYATAVEGSIDWDSVMKIEYLKVFSLVLFGKEQLPVMSFDELLGCDYGTTQSILDSLRSIVAFSSNQDVRLYHTSLYDYLISEGTREKAWFIDEGKGKAFISQRCFKVMESLRFNICMLDTSCLLNKDVPGIEERVKSNISVPLIYSCRHWASHLRETPYSEELCNQLESFAFNQLLYWIEVLSLTGSLYIFLLPSLESAITWIGDKHSRLSDFFQDAHYHLIRFIEPISQSSPHLYMSFLPLMRENSIFARHYATQVQSLTCVKYIGDKPQMACTRQVNVGSRVNSISYSPDGERIASGSEAGVIEVWDVVSGRRLLDPLEGHSDRVTSVAYSGDGKYIASGSGDNTVQVRNALTGERVLGPFIGHSEVINTVAFSRDGKHIASGSDDRTVRLWDVESGTLVEEPLKRHSDSVEILVFSPDGHHLATGSRDTTIIVWDAYARNMISNPFKGHSGPVDSLSFSPNSDKIASGSRDCTIRMWEVLRGAILRTFSGDGMGWVYSVAYSGDGKHILSGSRDNIVRMWNAEDSSSPPIRFEGHTDWIRSVSFALDCKHFASGSDDGTIRIWDLKGRVTDPEFRGQTGAVRAIAISPKTGKFLVSGSEDHTVCVWNTENGDLIKGPLKGHSSWVMSVAFSTNEIRFASGSADKSIRIWSMINDKFVICNGHTDWVRSVAFSPDGKHLASGSDDNSTRVWNVHSGSMEDQLIIKQSSSVTSVCYSPDGKKIVSGSKDNTIRIWDDSNANLLSTFEGHSSWIRNVAYSHDGLYVVSGSEDSTIRVWENRTSHLVYDPITGHTGSVNSVCFSYDGSWIISGSADKTICIWNASTGSLFFQARVSASVNSVSAFPSSDGKYIKFTSSSYDGTIHVWSVSIEEERKKWRLEDDGWLTGNNDKLLMWIPPDLRKSIVNGPCIHTLNTRFQTKLRLSANLGDKWTVCFPCPEAPAS